MDLRITYGSDSRQRLTGLFHKKQTGGFYYPPVKGIQHKIANVPLPYLLVGRSHTFE
jgi:hypothetical protein